MKKPYIEPEFENVSLLGEAFLDLSKEKDFSEGTETEIPSEPPPSIW